MADLRNVRNEFPILSRYPELVYLDSACTSLKPDQVIEAEMSYYREYGACGGRSSHRLGRKTSEAVDEARTKVAQFVGGTPEGLVWTKNTTEALNLISNSFDFSKKRKVVTTVMEHHAVLLPYMKLREAGKIELEILHTDQDRPGEIGKESWQKAIDRNTALVVTNCGTNSTGITQDVQMISKIAHDNGALLCIDGAQGVPHHMIDMKRLGMDFLCFSGHKMLGPTGIGAMIASKDHLKDLNEYIVGGGTVKTVSREKADYMDDFSRFEAGIQDYAGIFGLAAACGYLKKIGMENVEAHEKMLAAAMISELEYSGVEIYGPKTADKSALYSFNFKKAKAHDVALMLDQMNIAVRSGLFCAQPAMEAMGAKDGAVRASGYIYTTHEDIKKLGDALRKSSVLYS